MLFLAPHRAFSQDSILADKNGDGEVAVGAFGDSITYGIGDETSRGFPPRLAAYLGVPVVNGGEPGEELTLDGVARIPTFVSVSGRRSDLVVLLEGANDAFNDIGGDEYYNALQKAINVIKALGREPVLSTLPRPCCEHGGIIASTNGYSSAVRTASAVNNLRLIDYQHAWDTTCVNKGACELYNLPEGLHPNARGYEVMAQTAAAAILGIDIFASDGAEQLEQALGLEAGTVIVKPTESE